MDPYAPINGISIERYAELAADISDAQDPDKQAEIVQQKGVTRADWEAAKAGWTARMQDMALMGAVATRFMPLYQAALAKKSPAPQVSFEDYVAMSGCVPVMGLAGMLAHYKLSQAQWTQIAGHWNGLIPTSPQYMQFGILVEQEAARLRAGGGPKPLGTGAPPMQAPQPGYPQQPYVAGNPWGTPAQQQQFNRQAADFGAQVGSAFAAFGSALGTFVDQAASGFTVGARVMVTWSDGNRYPGTVSMVQSGQVQIAFPDGRQVWVPTQYVSYT